ncbi:hypothetical protein SEA_FUNSIZED_26 [Mycobacterium phage Funsized]|nr:hypothetical protein SEA_FUNSIZED_26 [Mycobacterium phage Funsized]
MPDNVREIVTTAQAVMLEFFGPRDTAPALAGQVSEVRLFAGEGIPLAAWNSIGGCGDVFAWVRVLRRYRTRAFPTATIDAAPCGLAKAVAIEVGLASCASMDEQPRWEDYAREADESMDTAWRLEEALCVMSRRLKLDDSERLTGTDTIVPYGPDGGVLAWTGVLYATY